MPDFLVGDYASADMFSGTEEWVIELSERSTSRANPRANKKKTEWFSKFPGAIPSQSGPVAKLAKEIKAKSGGKLGSIGACWGYKVIVESEGAGEFDAIAGIHPS